MKQKIIATAISAVLAVGSSAYGATIFDTDFSGAPDGGLGGAAGWEGQLAWTIASGMATASGSWARARNVTGFRAEVGEQVQVNLNGLVLTGTQGGTDAFSFGLAKSNEHTGAVTPQMAGTLNWNGGILAIGGASDTGYTAGDILNVALLFTRTGADAWSLDSTINNTTDGTSFAGSATPSNATGNITAETVGGWLDAAPGNQINYGMRELDNPGIALTLQGISVVTIPEPATGVALVSALAFGCFRRRR